MSKSIVQPLLPNFHKGQAGRIGVIGGCEDYTGAPFFSCHSAALLGSDMNHIVCEKLAAPTIKLYSPDLMVHPYLYELLNPEIRLRLTKDEYESLSKKSTEEILKGHDKLDELIDSFVLPKVLQLLNRIEITIVGPGFGRDPLMLKTLLRIIEQIKVMNKPIILDADALYLLTVDTKLIKNYEKAVITPNVVEFDRLSKALNIPSVLNETNFDKIVECTERLSRELGNVTVFHKNRKDVIVKKNETLVNDFKGSNKRVGGQGDTLTGAIATFVNWSYHYENNLWDTSDHNRLSHDVLLVIACFAASSVVRLAMSKAFAKYKRSLQTSNIHEFLGEAYVELFGDTDEFKL